MGSSEPLVAAVYWPYSAAYWMRIIKKSSSKDSAGANAVTQAEQMPMWIPMRKKSRAPITHHHYTNTRMHPLVSYM